MIAALLLLRFIFFLVGAIIVILGFSEIQGAISKPMRQIQKEVTYDRGCKWLALGAIIMAITVTPF
jgi:hypothetical protein|tara:strand:- start:17222 stop:17419 length:198 start_codon:yes stop_codon:yes gene_type:complete